MVLTLFLFTFNTDLDGKVRTRNDIFWIFFGLKFTLTTNSVYKTKKGNNFAVVSISRVKPITCFVKHIFVLFLVISVDLSNIFKNNIHWLILSEN